MNAEYFSFTMNRRELAEIHQALLARFIMEETLRGEHGLEEIDYPDHLMKIEQMLGMDPDAAHELYHDMEDELWEYAWNTYTDEWAWHRAGQDADKLISKKGFQNGKSREEITEALYEKNFERYTSEIDMREIAKRLGQKPKRKR